jgi:serine phosphatase RsbU (regulator of sigma subunit)
VIPLEAEVTLLGRGDDNDIQICEAHVSKHHAEIRRTSDGFVLSDVGSKAGVLCNGRTIKQRVLHGGDRIMLGRSCATPILFRSADDSVRGLGSNLFSSVAETGGTRSLDQLARFLEFSRTLSSDLTAAEVVETVVDLAIQMTRAERGCVIVRGEDGSFEFTAVRGKARAPSAEGSPHISESIVRQVLKEKAPRVVGDVALDTVLAISQSVMSLRLGSVVAMPLWRHALAATETSAPATDEVFGVLYLDSRESREAFGDLDVGILETLARDASSAIENARLMREARDKQRMDEELARAKEVQTALVPDQYWSEEFFDVAGSFVPCLELAGDYLGQFRVADGRVAFVVADVCGKGVQAALLAAALQGTLVGEFETVESLPEIVGRANRVISQLAPLGRFISMLCCSLAPDGELRYVNAGHNPMMVVRAGSIEGFVTGGLALGFDGTVAYEEHSLQMRPGDAVVLYTDGVTEALNHKRELFGDDRLLAALQDAHGRTADSICKDLLGAVESFCGGAPTTDDTAILAVAYRG